MLRKGDEGGVDAEPGVLFLPITREGARTLWELRLQITAVTKRPPTCGMVVGKNGAEVAYAIYVAGLSEPLEARLLQMAPAAWKPANLQGYVLRPLTA